MVPSAAVQDIHTGPADSSSYAYGVNVHEVVVGNFLSQNEAHTNAFHWRPGVGMQLLLGLPGVTSSQAIAVNDQGVIVGGCTIAKNTYAVMWSGGPAVEMKALWCPPPLKAPKVSAQPPRRSVCWARFQSTVAGSSVTRRGTGSTSTHHDRTLFRWSPARPRSRPWCKAKRTASTGR